jgi:hypothetical protein
LFSLKIQGVFDAPIEMVWKLAEDQIEQGNKIHPNTRNNKTETISETSFINTWEQDDANGQTSGMKVKGRSYYPLGIAFEILEGPFADSKYFVYYIPLNNNKTRITVVGIFKSSILPEEQLKPIVLGFLEKAFSEDFAYLNALEPKVQKSNL